MSATLLSDLEHLLKPVGVKRLTPPEGFETESLSGVVALSTAGPYNPALFEDSRFSGAQKMFDGYLRVHGTLAAAGIPSIVVVRDEFALNLRTTSGSPLSERHVAVLIRRIRQYSLEFIRSQLRIEPPQSLFQVVRESHVSAVTGPNSDQLLADFDLGRGSAYFKDLDIKNVLDLVTILKKVPNVRKAANTYIGPDYLPLLVEWEGMVTLWRAAGIPVSVALAELETIEGSRDMRQFYAASLEALLKS